MLLGFEDYTYSLTDYEKNILLPVIVLGLSKKIEVANIVTGDYIVKKLKTAGYKINGVRLRRIIAYIRQENIIPGLVANSRGYFVSNDITTLTKHYKSLKQRAAAIDHIANCMHDHLQKLINPKPF